MRKGKRLMALVLAAVLILSGCSRDSGESTQKDGGVKTTAANEQTAGEKEENTSKETPDPVTLKILFRGSKVDGFDEVYEEYLKRTKDTLNIELDFTWIENADYKEKLNLEITSGAEYDLVYDALWINLRTLAAEDYYADLSEYFNNPEYPGLEKAFSEEVMENNRYYGKMCYIPLIRGYGNGAQSVLYRQDLADKWGIGQIDSYEKMENYWRKAKEEGMLPLSVRNNRGYYQLFTSGAYYPGAAEAGIMQVNSAGVDLFFYVKDNKVVSIAPSGGGDEAFKNFPDGWNYDFTVQRYVKFAEWTEEGFISPDSLTITDDETPFYAGEAASFINGSVSKSTQKLAEYVPEAQLGEFVWDERIRNMEKHAIVTNYMSNNGLCVPESSKNKEAVMRFLDWMFSSKENHDLFEMGIEGKDYEITEYGTYRALSGYPDNFPGYGFTWTPEYVTFSDSERAGQNGLKYREYELDPESYVAQPVCGFSFDTSTDVDLATYVAQVRAVSEKVDRPKSHGILNDGTQTYDDMIEMINKNVQECYEAGLQNIIDALEIQLNEHMASQAGLNK